MNINLNSLTDVHVKILTCSAFAFIGLYIIRLRLKYIFALKFVFSIRYILYRISPVLSYLF